MIDVSDKFKQQSDPRVGNVGGVSTSPCWWIPWKLALISHLIGPTGWKVQRSCMCGTRPGSGSFPAPQFHWPGPCEPVRVSLPTRPGRTRSAAVAFCCETKAGTWNFFSPARNVKQPHEVKCAGLRQHNTEFLSYVASPAISFITRCSTDYLGPKFVQIPSSLDSA